MGNVYSGMGDYRIAVDVYSKSLNTMDRLGDLFGQCNVLNNIGNYFSCIYFQKVTLISLEDLK